MLPKFGHEQKGIFSKMDFFCFFILPFLSLSLSFLFHFLALHFHFIGFILMRKDFGTAFRFVGLDGGRLVQVGSRATFSFAWYFRVNFTLPHLVLQPV